MEVLTEEDPYAVERAIHVWDEYLGTHGKMPPFHRSERTAAARHNTSWVFENVSHAELLADEGEDWGWIVDVLSVYDRLLLEGAIRMTMEHPLSLWRIEQSLE